MADASVEDAAILMMAMGAEAAAQVMRQLDPKAVQAVSEAMAQLHTAQPDRVDAVLARFGEQATGTRSLVDAPAAYLREVLTRALGDDKARLLLERVVQPQDRQGIDTLRWMDPASVAELIAGEHPQILASILVHLERDQAAAVLTQFDERLRADVMVRIATLDGIQPSALEELDQVLSKILMGGVSLAPRSALGGIKPVAEIMNFIPSSMEEGIMNVIREQDETLAQKIADNMFTFDDLLKLDDKAIQLLLREIQSDQLVVALKGAGDEMRDKIFKNMSSRAAETLREDLEARGPMRLSEVEAEQKAIMTVVRRLADDGQIAMGSGGDDAFV